MRRDDGNGGRGKRLRERLHDHAKRHAILGDAVLSKLDVPPQEDAVTFLGDSNGDAVLAAPLAVLAGALECIQAVATQ